MVERANAQHITISIHALREEGDDPDICVNCPLEDFYPRPPRGGRRVFRFQCCPVFLFLSTPSARRATWIVSEDARRQL